MDVLSFTLASLPRISDELNWVGVQKRAMRIIFAFRPYNESLVKYCLIKLSHRLSLGVWQFGVELPRARALPAPPTSKSLLPRFCSRGPGFVHAHIHLVWVWYQSDLDTVLGVGSLGGIAKHSRSSGATHQQIPARLPPSACRLLGRYLCTRSITLATFGPTLTLTQSWGGGGCVGGGEIDTRSCPPKARHHQTPARSPSPPAPHPRVFARRTRDLCTRLRFGWVCYHLCFSLPFRNLSGTAYSQALEFPRVYL